MTLILAFIKALLIRLGVTVLLQDDLDRLASPINFLRALATSVFRLSWEDCLRIHGILNAIVRFSPRHRL